MVNLRPFLEKPLWINLYALALTIPLYPILSLPVKILIISLSAIWLLQGKYKDISKDYIPYIFLFSSLYFINVIGFTYTENTEHGLSRLSSRLSYVIFPLVIFTSSLDEKKIKTIFWLFSGAVIALSFTSLALAFSKNEMNGEHPLMYLNLSTTVKHHPSYLSFLIIVTFFFILQVILKLKEGKWLILLVLLEVYLVVYLFLLISRGPIIGFVVALLGSLVVFRSYSRKAVITLCVVVFISLIGLTKIDYFRERLTKPFVNIEQKVSTDENESTNNHFKSWYCAIRSLSDYHFFTGYGSGDERDILVSCYSEHHWDIMVQERLDAHNEYLSCMMRTGFAELLLMLLVIGVGLYWSIRGKNLIYFGQVTLFAVAFLFTSLNDFTAVLLLSYFNALLFFQSRRNAMQLKSESIV